MKIVLTNDDGYGEPGLITLAHVAQKLGTVIVVAPQVAQSGVGHLVTMKTPLRVQNGKAPGHFIVQGSPADCTRLALKCIAPNAEWVLAGVNPGANLGSDVYQSGTIAAAREAAILGAKAIAVSQYIALGWTIDWQAVAYHVAHVLPLIMKEPLAAGQFWSINLPSPISAGSRVDHRFCPLDKHPHKYLFRKTEDLYYYEGIIHDRPRAPGSDVDVCFSGRISVTRMEI